MALTWYEAVSDDGGAAGSQITSGTVNQLFPALTASERLIGSDKYRKVYLESDTAVTVYVGLQTNGLFNACLFESSGSAEAVGDLTGSENRYGAGYINSGSTVDQVVVNDDADWTKFRASEFIAYGTDVVQIDSITDLGGTLQINLASSLSIAPDEGEYITSVIPITLPSATKVPFWMEIKVAAGSVKDDDYNTVGIIVAS